MVCCCCCSRDLKSTRTVRRPKKTQRTKAAKARAQITIVGRRFIKMQHIHLPQLALLSFKQHGVTASGAIHPPILPRLFCQPPTSSNRLFSRTCKKRLPIERHVPVSHVTVTRNLQHFVCGIASLYASKLQMPI